MREADDLSCSRVTSLNDEMMPFGNGIHAYPDRSIATDAMEITLMNLVYRHEFKYPEGIPGRRIGKVIILCYRGRTYCYFSRGRRRLALFRFKCSRRKRAGSLGKLSKPRSFIYFRVNMYSVTKPSYYCRLSLINFLRYIAAVSGCRSIAFNQLTQVVQTLASKMSQDLTYKRLVNDV